jgi:hypothetical protein
MPRHKRKPPVPPEYNDILALLGKLIDSTEEDLSLSALDPLHALRMRVESLSTALRITLIALSCYGQKESFIRKASQEIGKLLSLQEAWDSQEAQG